MTPPKIDTTGDPAVDDATAEIAVHLRNGGMNERDAIAEAQRIRDQIMSRKD